MKRFFNIFEFSISSSMSSLLKQPSIFLRKIMSTICNYRGMRNSKRKSEFISHSDLRYSYFLRKYSICRAFQLGILERNSRRMSRDIIRNNTSTFQKFRRPLIVSAGCFEAFWPKNRGLHLGQNSICFFLLISDTNHDY